MNKKEAEKIWKDIAKRVGPTAEQVEELLKNPPDEVTRTITLRGASAVIFSYVSKTLEHGLNLTPDEAAAYLLRQGAESELKKREELRKVVQAEDEA